MLTGVVSACAVSPMIENEAPQQQLYVLDETLLITVTIRSNLPLDSVIWDYKRTPLSSDQDRVTVTQTSIPRPSEIAVNTMIRVVMLTGEDAGEYTVTATNAAGVGFLTFDIAVLGKFLYLVIEGSGVGEQEGLHT